MFSISIITSDICPAYAGVILLLALDVLKTFDLSRVCGGDPVMADILKH